MHFVISVMFVNYSFVVDCMKTFSLTFTNTEAHQPLAVSPSRMLIPLHYLLKSVLEHLFH